MDATLASTMDLRLAATTPTTVVVEVVVVGTTAEAATVATNRLPLVKTARSTFKINAMMTRHALD